MLFIRIVLLLYVIPLMLMTALTCIFGKIEWIKYVWIYGTLAILTIIIAVKMIFCIISFIE